METSTKENKTMSDIIQEGIYQAPDNIGIIRPFECSINPKHFQEAFMYAVHRKAFFKDNNTSYIIDQYNKETINQLYYYLNGSKLFKGNLYKGILLLGKIGCGKSLLMEGIIFAMESATQPQKNVTRIHAKDLHNAIIGEGMEYYRQRPLFIDDIGKEQSEVKEFGTIMKPFEDLIAYRYGEGGVMFGTSNFKLEDLGYPHHIKDRMKEMFNIMILPGPSRRK